MSISKTLTSFDEPDTPLMQTASAGYFDALGVQPMMGRAFAPEEDRPGTRAVMVMSYELWHRRFGEDRNILGRTTELDVNSFTVPGSSFVVPGFGFVVPGSVPTPIGSEETCKP